MIALLFSLNSAEAKNLLPTEIVEDNKHLKRKN